MGKAKKIHKDDSIMAKLLEDKSLDIKEYKYGDLVEGIVVSVTPGEVLLDVGAKSEAIITGEELVDSDKSYKNLKSGDSVMAMVIQPENHQGYIVLSLKRAEKDKKWATIEDAYKDESVLEVTVLEYTKGGLLVDCLGLRGFVPLSHLDRVHFTSDLAKVATGSEAELKNSLKVLAGKELKVKVIEFDLEKNRLVLSEKDAKDEYSPEVKEEKLAKIEEGDKLKGIVTGVMPFGLFVDLEGVEGLVHISEIAWEKVSNPGNYYQVGSPIEVLVLGIDEQSQKLALSVKRLIQNPWEGVEDRYPVGSTVQGKVSKIVPFGAFVNLENGLDGLIHVSEAAEPLKVGDEVTAVVTNVDGSKQKLALSTRQMEQEETQEKPKKTKKASKKDKEDEAEKDNDESAPQEIDDNSEGASEDEPTDTSEDASNEE